MKVLHLTSHLDSGGITVYILRLIRHLREQGVEVCVVSSGGNYAPLFHERGAQTFEIPFRTKSELHPKIYFALPQIINIIKEQKIDVIHAHTRITQVMAFWIQKVLKIPVVTTCHGFYKRRLGRRLLPAWGDYAVAISDGVAKHLTDDHRVPLQKVKIVNNAVDFQELDAAYARHDTVEMKKRYGFRTNDPVIGVVARLVADKGHEYLIRAMVELRRQYPNLKLLIVGDGKYKKFLQQLVAKLGLTDHVVFTGNLIDVTEALSAMDLFVFPATWREGFGLSIAEAMACRKAVVVTNVWALNRIIHHRINGMLVEPKCVTPLVEAIDELFRDHVLRQKIQTQARQLAEELFSIPRMAREIQQVYQEVLRDYLTEQKCGL
ncbi:MAG: glycosyltransferase family 4 protein [Candidatus Omnitrophica bacterium]|nr:glycosyltransferase family 4 protein [Candidatus Omnitrophota bacterium]MDD5672376.1 glycosyltransferase family 4 protein [Candidatus Omnitrophota bacterium]